MSEEEKEAFEYFTYFNLARDIDDNDIKKLEILLNLIKKQQKELEPIKKLNIPVETLVSEFNRLEDLEDNTEMLKSELDKKDKMIGFMATAIDNYDSQLEICKFKNRGHVIEYFKNLVEKENK